MPFDQDWLQSLLAQQGQQPPPAGPVQQPQGLTLNGYNAAMGAPYAQPARPITRTPPTAQDFSAYLYGPPMTQDPSSNLTPMGPAPAPPPLPSWLPQNVQNYINQRPSYAEGQRQAIASPTIAEPDSPTPQIGDLQRVFNNRIGRNSPTSNPMSGKPLRAIIRGGYLTGGSEI